MTLFEVGTVSTRVAPVLRSAEVQPNLQLSFLLLLQLLSRLYIRVTPLFHTSSSLVMGEKGGALWQPQQTQLTTKYKLGWVQRKARQGAV